MAARDDHVQALQQQLQATQGLVQQVVKARDGATVAPAVIASVAKPSVGSKVATAPGSSAAHYTVAVGGGGGGGGSAPIADTSMPSGGGGSDAASLHRDGGVVHQPAPWDSDSSVGGGWAGRYAASIDGEQSLGALSARSATFGSGSVGGPWGASLDRPNTTSGLSQGQRRRGGGSRKQRRLVVVAVVWLVFVEACDGAPTSIANTARGCERGFRSQRRGVKAKTVQTYAGSSYTRYTPHR